MCIRARPGSSWFAELGFEKQIKRVAEVLLVGLVHLSVSPGADGSETLNM